MFRFSGFVPWLLTVVALYGGYCALLFLLQRSLVFPRLQIREPPGQGEEYPQRQVIWLETSFGRVESWYFPAVGRGKSAVGSPDGVTRLAPAVVIAHGNAEVIDHLPPLFLRFTDLGLAVLLVEYPGYGRSDGSPSQETVRETFVAAYDLLAARPEIDRNRIIAFGRSVGGAAACVLASERPVASLILFSTFTSLRSMAHRFLVPGFLARDPFDNLQVVRSYPRPVLVLHGSEDGLIPFRHGETLAAAAPRGRLVSYPCGHNDCPADWERFWSDVEAFLSEAGVVP